MSSEHTNHSSRRAREITPADRVARKALSY